MSSCIFTDWSARVLVQKRKKKRPLSAHQGNKIHNHKAKKCLPL